MDSVHWLPLFEMRISTENWMPLKKIEVTLKASFSLKPTTSELVFGVYSRRRSNIFAIVEVLRSNG